MRTLELVPGVEDSHVRRNRVESTAPYDVHTFVSCLAVVVQLHALEKLHTATQKHTHRCTVRHTYCAQMLSYVCSVLVKYE